MVELTHWGDAGTLGIQFAGEHGQHRVVAELVVVDHVFMAEGDAKHPLAYQGGDLVLDALRRPRVAEAGGKAPDQADGPVRDPEQEGTGIGGDRPAVEAGTTRRVSTGANSNSAGLHSFGIGGLLCIAARLRSRRRFAGSEPRCTWVL